MDFKEKLEIAADIASDNAVFDSNPWNVFNDGFVKGAEWLQSQPIVDRLSEGERERIREKFTRYTTPNGFSEYETHEIVAACLEEIFGKEMFLNKE